MKRFRLILRPLSPIHIGTGEEISPLEYVIEDVPTRDGFQPYLFRVDPGRVLARVAQADPGEAERIVRAGDPKRVAHELRKHVDRDRDALYFAACSAGVDDLFDDRALDPNNQLLVGTIVRDPGSGLPVIPGSSLKGAMRTAVLVAWADGNRYDTRGDDWRRHAEKRIAGHGRANDDPFRCLAVSDAFLGDKEDGIVDEVMNYSLARRRCNSIQMIKELVDDIYRTSGAVAAECEARIDDKLSGSRLVDREGRTRQAVSRGLAMEEIGKACHRFYRGVAEKEYLRFYKSGSIPPAKERYEQILEEYPATASKEGTFLLRVGHFSHFESVTLGKGLAKPSRRGVGRSRALAGGELPMGWLAVTIESAG